MAVRPRDRRFTVDEYYRMAEAGIIRPDERVELVDGRIVAMNPIGSPHAWCVSRLNRVFMPRDDVLTNVQNPICLDDRSEPEPDLVVMRLETPTDRHPRPEDILLVIEVADTSLAYDRGVKLPMYAQAGIPEVWVVNLVGEAIERYADPTGGGYRVVERVGRGERLESVAVPSLWVDVDAVLGPTGDE